MTMSKTLSDRIKNSITKNRNRRSQFGARRSVNTSNRKSLHASINDRIIYRSYRQTNEDSIFHPDTLPLILGQLWNLYSISPLHNIKFTRVKLKQYASRIKQELASHIIDDNVEFITKVEALPVVQDSDCPFLQIEVYVIKNRNNPVLKFNGIILSCNDDFTFEDNLIHLPLFLSVGTTAITRIVHQVLFKLFNAYIQPLRITEDDLAWLSAMLSDTSENERNFVFKFLLMDSISQNHITMTMPSALLRTLWNNIHQSDVEEISHDEVCTFHKQIQSQLTAIFSIQFESLKLNKLTTIDTIIACEGKVKMLTGDSVIKTLSFLTDVSLMMYS